MIAPADLKRSNRGAIARALSLVEDDPAGARALIGKIFPECGRAMIIGITGPAGAGKSSLISALAAEIARSRRAHPAVLAVDPTSHLTGGAILGDRARMASLDRAGVFVRSLASRGSTGAVSAALRDCVRVLEYAGFDPVIIESVGAGQTEVDISQIADITVVVFSPNTGDNIQAIKAGLTEIGDVYLVSKSDLAGSARLYESLRSLAGSEARDALVMRASVKRPRSIAELAGHLAVLSRKRRRQKAAAYPARLERELRDIVLNKVRERAEAAMGPQNKTYTRCVERLAARKMSPHEAARRVAGSLR